MTKYLLSRIVRSLFSIVIVVAIVMTLVYTCLDRNMVFRDDANYNKLKSNAKEVYQMQQWENYGYVEYIPYTDWLQEKLFTGEIDQDTYDKVSVIGYTSSDDNKFTKQYMEQFKEEMEAQGLKIKRLDADKKGKSKKLVDGGAPRLYAYTDRPLLARLWDFLSGLVTVDNIHNVDEDDDIGERGLTFTWYDPAYGGEKFSPAIMGNGTTHKYLLYFTDSFPYIGQNLVNINLGESYTIKKGIDVFDILTETQGSYAYSTVTYPSGNVEVSADDLHSATYVAGSLANGTPVVQRNFIDDYTNVSTHKAGLSKMGYSFSIGIVATVLSYLLGIPLGTVMALNKDKLIDKLGTIYIVFIIAVPSLAYIFLFKSLGGAAGLPTTFDMEHPSTVMYILPVISLALPSVASLMKWLRRYMIDQMNSDYVKFARSGGLGEGEIFTKHVLKNAIIPIVHGIPGSILGAMTGAIITERVYVVPGAGNILTRAINLYDNGVIIGMTMFYALLSVVSIILGDVLMSLMDPRISFTSKAR